MSRTSWSEIHRVLPALGRWPSERLRRAEFQLREELRTRRKVITVSPKENGRAWAWPWAAPCTRTCRENLGNSDFPKTSRELPSRGSSSAWGPSPRPGRGCGSSAWPPASIHHALGFLGPLKLLSSEFADSLQPLVNEGPGVCATDEATLFLLSYWASREEDRHLPGSESRRHQENLLIANEDAKVLLRPPGTAWLRAGRGGGPASTPHPPRQAALCETLLRAPGSFSCLLPAGSSARNTFFQNMKHNLPCSLPDLKRGNVVHNFTFIAYF